MSALFAIPGRRRRQVTFGAVRPRAPMPWIVLCALLLALVREARADGVRIHEFVAVNAASLVDEDGDSSDWIELYNGGDQDVDLAGWHLTDDADDLSKWTFPDVTLAAGRYLVVFASGKDRGAPESELHTSFRLDGDGEYLALARPDGAVVHEFAPSFPPQREDVAFGFGEEFLEPGLVRIGAAATMIVPTDDSLRRDWTGAAEPFDDTAEAGWTPVTTGLGYDTASSEGVDGLPELIGYWTFDDVEDREIALDSSGHERHANITSQFALMGSGGTAKPRHSPDGRGHSRLPGDRALNFGATANGALVDVPGALVGAFDSAVANDAISIGLWLFGGDQPADGSVFWGASAPNGGGTRSLNAHVPWSDGTIYWDTSGCCDGSQRISRPEADPRRWRGEWNHYVFVKDGDRKQIWQNGSLFHEGTNTSDLTGIRSFTIGGAPHGLSYGGMIDDFAVWDAALEEGQIQSLAQGVSPLDLTRFAPLIATDVRDRLLDRGTSMYVRLRFDLDPRDVFDAIVLRVRYDDGFAAYLNGEEVARRNAPDVLRHDSRAISDRPKSEALAPHDIDLSAYAHLLRPGANVLAIHALNDDIASPDFLIVPELLGVRRRAERYLSPATPGTSNVAGALGFVAGTRFGMEHGFYAEPFSVEITSETDDALVYYTADGSSPDPDTPSAQIYSAPVLVEGTTTLRARAFKDGYIPSEIDTRTYLFIADVASQPRQPEGFPARWSGGFPADYEVDPEIVDGTLPGYGFEEALLAVPSISIVMAPDDLFGAENGIYYNSGNKSEKAGSVEFIDPAGRRGFQANAGVRIHGLTSSRHTFTPKHSFRVVFKRRFGPPNLEFPLFTDSPVERFDQFVLKGLSTDTWPVEDGWTLGNAPAGTRRWYRENALYMREQWMKDSLRAMGQTSTHGAFVHLYLNGLYWGLYNLTERPTDSFQAEHVGGEREEYDVLRDFAEIHSGTKDAWDGMMALARAGLTNDVAYQRIQGNFPDGTRNPEYERYVDVDSLIDYMILHIYAGADDWPNHNWWAARRRGPESPGFKFFAWDQEISNNANNRYGFSAWGVRFELASAPDTPSYLYSRMRLNETFRMRFADRVHRHFVDGGALSPTASASRWDDRATEIDQAIVGESARWGDARRGAPYRREREWLGQLEWIRDSYLPTVIPMALERFGRVRLYPDVEAPVFSQQGGRVARGLELGMTVEEGTIYYTLDGTDPREQDGAISPAAATAASGASIRIRGAVTVKARARFEDEWSALNEAFFYREVPLRVTELMYHPLPEAGSAFDADDHEFIELENVAAEPLDLEGFRIVGGLRYDFEPGILEAGGVVVIVKNRDAFASRYGTEMTVAGEYSGQLSNSGETIRILGPLGERLLDVEYADAWYPATDGEGFSLSIVDPTAAAETWSEPTSWRPSEELHGSPGAVPLRDDGRQLPGDLNQDSSLDIADVARSLPALFGGGPVDLPCEGTIDAAGNRAVLDVNGDGDFNLSDSIYLLNYLFLGDAAPALGTDCIRLEGCPDSCR